MTTALPEVDLAPQAEHIKNLLLRGYALFAA